MAKRRTSRRGAKRCAPSGRGWLARLFTGDPEEKARREEQQRKARIRGAKFLDEYDRRFERQQHRKQEERARHEAAMARARRLLEEESAKTERARVRETSAKSPTARRNATKDVERFVRRADRVEETARRIERGEFTPSELKELMTKGALRLR